MNQTSYTPSLATAIWPRATWIRNISLIIGGSLLIALTAQIELPLWPVPVTGQTFGVLLVAALLGRRLGTMSIITYLVEGAIGLPFFSGGGAGAAHLVGPTGGYLAGFVVAAYVVGWLCERGWDRRLETAVLVFMLGNLVIYVPGLLWLSRFVGWQSVLHVGLFPFIPGDILKLLLAALTLPTGWKFLNR